MVVEKLGIFWKIFQILVQISDFWNKFLVLSNIIEGNFIIEGNVQIALHIGEAGWATSICVFLLFVSYLPFYIFVRVNSAAKCKIVTPIFSSPPIFLRFEEMAVVQSQSQLIKPK